MFTQNIDKTFIGTSDPVTLHQSLSYYGPHMPSGSKTTLALSHQLVDSYIDSHLGTSCSIKLSADVTAGIALPSWSASINVESGTITSDVMSLTITDNTLMGGVMIGAIVRLNFSFAVRTWHPGHFNWGWHSGYWNDWDGFDHAVNFDVIPIGVDLIVGLVALIPKFKVLFQVLPSGLIDHMQDFEDDAIVDADGVFINASIPMKWDLISIGRAIAETGLEVASLGLTPAGAAVVTAIVEIAEFIITLIDKLKVVQVAFGPQIDIVFPLRIKITKLVAGYDNDREAFAYDSLSFNGNTITATNTSATKISDGAPQLERIGIHCRQSVELLETDLGAWAHFGLFWIFAVSPSKDFHFTEILEKELGFDLGLADFNSSMSNAINGSGNEGTSGGIPDSVEFKFI